MVRRLCLLGCLLWSLTGEEPADELARALRNISQGVARPAGGLGVGPQDLPIEFDVVDRHMQTEAWWPTVQSDSTDVCLLSAEKIIEHGTPEERLEVVERCLFDGRSHYCRSGCIVSFATVGDSVLAAGWGDLNDRQHWELLATWLNQVDQEGNWDCGCSWRELGAPVRSAGFLHALLPWCTGTSEQRVKAAHLLWLMTQSWGNGGVHWAGSYRVVIDTILRLADDSEVAVRRAATRALSGISVMWGDDQEPWNKQQQRLLRACDDPDLAVCLTAAMWFVVSRDRFPEQIAAERTHALRTLLARGTPELLVASKPWLRYLTQVRKFTDEQRPLFAEVAKRLVGSDDRELFGVGCSISAHLDDAEIDRLCAERATALDVTDSDILSRLLSLPLGQELHRQLVQHVEGGEAPLTYQRMELLSRFVPRRLGWEFRALDDRDPQVALQTFRVLGGLQEPWIPDALVARLDDYPDQRARRQRAMNSLKLDAVEPTLRRRMRPDDPLRSSAILALAHAANDIDRPEDLADLLRSILLNPTDPQRIEALHLLRDLWSRHHGQERIPNETEIISEREPLRELLARFADDLDPLLRREVLNELVLCPARSYARRVFTGLKDADANVRQVAARALLALGRTGAVVIQTTPEEEKRSDVITAAELIAGLSAEDDFVRVSYATLLCQQTTPESVTGLQYLVHHGQDDKTFEQLR
ncbi:MAG TPA: hypothetical protein VHX44_01880, partial [Planctomycetota bacterium]|nr:hypothetical protein [Planctomycetota bacterium]